MFFLDFLHRNKDQFTEAEKAFNQTVIYGKDADAMAVINTSRRFPMMANYQLVIVKEV